jgi:hypothetical protein
MISGLRYQRRQQINDDLKEEQDRRSEEQKGNPKLCEVCYCEYSPKGMVYYCKCRADICNECFFDWAKNQVDSTNLARKEWKCPQSDKEKMKKCIKRTVEDVFTKVRNVVYSPYKSKVTSVEQIDNSQRSVKDMLVDLDDLLLDRFLVASEDVRKCPKESCKYAGFMPEKEGGYINCVDDF